MRDDKHSVLIVSGGGRGCTDLARMIVLDIRSMDAGISGPCSFESIETALVCSLDLTVVLGLLTFWRYVRTIPYFVCDVRLYEVTEDRTSPRYRGRGFGNVKLTLQSDPNPQIFIKPDTKFLTTMFLYFENLLHVIRTSGVRG